MALSHQLVDFGLSTKTFATKVTLGGALQLSCSCHSDFCGTTLKDTERGLLKNKLWTGYVMRTIRRASSDSTAGISVSASTKVTGKALLIRSYVARVKIAMRSGSP